MNDAISFVVAVFACLVVMVLMVLGIRAVLGEWSLLVWVALGFGLLMTVMRRVNA